MVIKNHIKQLFNSKQLYFDNTNQFNGIVLQQAVLRQGTIPYVRLNLNNKEILFCLDSGCSHNLLTKETYLSVKHLETVVTLRKIYF